MTKKAEICRIYAKLIFRVFRTIMPPKLISLN